MKSKIKKKKKSFFFLVVLPLWLLLFALVAGGIITVLYGYQFYPTFVTYLQEAREKVNASDRETFHLNESSYIYDKNGAVLAKLRKGGDSAYLTYEEIPREVVDAFIAIEDNSFYDNSGIDPKGIIRVGYDYIKSRGAEKHGASTITQQLARNVFLSQEKSLERKSKEILIAYLLTQKYSKDDIMEFYINNIYFANGYYGIEAAARGYFGVSVKELSLSQIAYLCAIPNRPSYYNPFDNPQNAISRRDKILRDMEGLGFISREDYAKALQEEIRVHETNYDMHNYETTYAIACAVKALMKEDGFRFRYHFDSQKDYKAYEKAYQEAYDAMKGQLYTGGYRIYTTIDPKMQAILQKSVDKELSFDHEKNEDGIYAFQGAATAVDNKSGKVVAIVGGRSQKANGELSLNRAFQSFRQPGSTIKPLLVYAPALQLGYLPTSKLKEIDVSQAKKATKKELVSKMKGPKMSLREAVEQSKNGCAYSLLNKIGIKYGMSFLEKMHYSKLVPADYNLSAALGGFTYGTTTAQMASAYATLANYGIYREESCIQSILDRDNHEVYQEYSRRVYEDETCRQMLDVLAGVMTRGTGKVLKWKSKVQAVGKTGTTNGSKDGWFCGATPYYTISVWCGYDIPRTLDSLYGGSYPGRIWKRAMKSYVKDLKGKHFKKAEVQTKEKEYLYWMNPRTLLSRGYTVQNYRDDFNTVDRVKYLTVQMKKVDQSEKSWEKKVNRLYRRGTKMIKTIYGTKAIKKAQRILDKGYRKVTGHDYKK